MHTPSSCVSEGSCGLQRQRSKVMAAQYPDIIKVCQSCGTEDFDVEATIEIAASLTPKYLAK